MLTRIRTFFLADRWLLSGLLLLVLFIVYTVVVASGALLYPTMYQEQWLLQRPLTGVDCVLRQWGNVGNPLPTLLGVLVLSILCLLLRYRPRVLLYLCLFFCIAVGAEWLGKHHFVQLLPRQIHVGLNDLACPQIGKVAPSTRIKIDFGVWWVAPPIYHEDVLSAYYTATTPFSFTGAEHVHGYPSGHAIRWCFIGFVACWLAWRQVKWRALRILCMVAALLIAFGGGFAEFFIGYHLITDLIGGYLLGVSLACFAIVVLSRNEQRNWKGRLLRRPTRDAMPFSVIMRL